MPVLRRLLLLTPALTLAARHALAQGGTHDHAAATPAAASQGRAKAPRDAYVYIGWPQDGQVINGTRFKVWFGTRNFGVAPAGVATPNTGHHHLLVDTPMPPLDQPIPNDRNHLHFGLGQTETMLELPPGTHTLQLVMGDADHVPHDPPVTSRRITIQVRPGRAVPPPPPAPPQ
ncbi:DUF4399 domain-containing protein [Paeniroseomonas aquatica]|uniref:DUF4399 domain-containing protein n=1 Tax=Paeniroseomonas aquatica TaxID=373043 RepID=A0ABT8A6M7_9PROT|nr:DUF4399 domain-containing protein [Paeniroseomonas aquatica]MDN3565345.1 DUF4399 domain-containing protein [Paeniroseomonas aquatica]